MPAWQCAGAPRPMSLFLTGARILADGAWHSGQGVLVDDGGAIEAVLPEHTSVPANSVALPPETLLAPGLVDVQVNGGGGILFNDTPTAEAARAIAATHRRLGTTAIMPTLITDTAAAMQRAAAAVQSPAPGILGVHFEGPFLSRARPGVHAPKLIRAPTEADLLFLEGLAAQLAGVVLLTVAPETVDDATLGRLAKAGVILSAGHTEASYERCTGALAAGLRGFTHLFNAMPGPAARLPGPAVAALLDRDSWCGVIADGVHVHPAMLALLLAAKPPGRVMLVSDAMPPVGTDLARFVLQGRTVHRDGVRLTTQDGTLAGAGICLADAVRFAVAQLGLTAAQALGMASEVPATFLGQQHRVGRIATGCRADLVLLTPGLEVLGTWLGGQWQGDPGVLAAKVAA
jgi:N-acetylglucosamine-6-phosphate deacetylase